jgi:RimJ/RimL family protein N-acetyltransferase
MHIKKGNLFIRSATPCDAAILCKWWNDGKVMEHAGFPKGLGITEQAVLANINDQSDSRKLLIIEANSSPIGEMSYREVDEATVQIGIKICDFSKQEKGFGTSFLKMLIEYLFFERCYEKIVLDTNLNNRRAQHVYEKIGFTRIGVRERSFVDQLGNPQSSVDYELLRENYIA